MLYLDSNAHSVFALHYHLIMTTKYRRRVFDDVISDRAKDIFLHIARSYNISLQEWKHDVDHIHILFSAHPNSCLRKPATLPHACPGTVPVCVQAALVLPFVTLFPRFRQQM